MGEVDASGEGFGGEFEGFGADFGVFSLGVGAFDKSLEDSEIFGGESGFAGGSTDGVDVEGFLGEGAHAESGSEEGSAAFTKAAVESDRAFSGGHRLDFEFPDQEFQDFDGVCQGDEGEDEENDFIVGDCSSIDGSGSG